MSARDSSGRDTTARDANGRDTSGRAALARDRRADACIARSAEFARPILAYLREGVHAAYPGATETLKWGFPHFMCEGMLCSMAAFKRHCSFGFWKGTLLVPDAEREDTRAKRLAAGKDLHWKYRRAR